MVGVSASEGETEGVGSECWTDNEGRESLLKIRIDTFRTRDQLPGGLLKKRNEVLWLNLQSNQCADAPF